MAAEFARLFGESDDEEDEFEGFGPNEIVNVLTTVPMSLFNHVNDKEVPADTLDGWNTVETNGDIENNEEVLPDFREPFSGQSRLNVHMDTDHPADFFGLFFTDDILALLVTETNRYAEQKILAGGLKENSRLKTWRPVVVGEMKMFFCLTLVMGMVQKSDIENYWTQADSISTPFFGKNMSRDRYLAILSNLHLVDNTLPVNEDPLYKVRPFVTHVLHKFTEVYTPDKDLSFDEATCAWKGRLRFRVYNPAKPTRLGIKLYQVCEADSGYCLGFDIYTGKSEVTTFCDALNIDPDYCETTRIVIGLLTKCGLLEKGHHVYMDNYYSSPELYNELELWSTYCCGTLRANRRGIPLAVKQKTIKLKQGEIISRVNGNLLCLRFHDKRDVVMLTNIHPATVNVLSKKDRKTKQPILKPTCVYEYCQKMGGVDLSDQIGSYYSVLGKSVKWYKKLFFHLLNLCIVNSYILYSKFQTSTKCLSHHEYILAVANRLLEEACELNTPKPVNRGRKCHGEIPDRLTARHFPSYIPAAAGAKRKHPARDCAVCNPTKKVRTDQHIKRKQTSFWCEDCAKPLCVPDCFRAFHTLKNVKAAASAQPESDMENEV